MTNGTTDPQVPALLRGEALIAKAIDAQISVEGLERLMALRDRLRAEDAEAAFIQALSGFQGDCPIIPKTRTVTIRPQSGAPYSYSFAPIEVIWETISPLLNKHGLAVTMDTTLTDTAVTVITTVHHVAGHSRTSTFMVPVEGGRMSKQHAVASASTYAARYSIRQGLGLFTGDEDDDAAGAGGLLSAEKQAVVAPPPPRRKGTGRVTVETSEPPAVADPVLDPPHASEARVHGLVTRVAKDLNPSLDLGVSLEEQLRASIDPGDAPLAEPERMALYGQIRLLLRGYKIAGTNENLQRAKTAVKLWLARELGVEHLEDIPQKHLARVRQEVPRLVEEAFTR